ncbi:hypothetical protein LPJ75_001814 [Coemansia sp. RSA 2598]|nr:hypothetical protein LPJ75_001814 [Coemansia sp. RSA 2598]
MDFIVPDRPLSGHSLRNMYLQVYVKMTNIYLEPDRQQCASEVWHTSGSNSERIVATAICAYDIDNIKDVAVELKEYVELDEGVDLRDHFTHLIYEAGVSEESPEYQNYLGKVRLDEGSIVCYPNTYQRRMLPLRLAEPTRSGCRRSSLSGG